MTHCHNSIPDGSSVIINFQNCQGCDELVNLDQGGARGLLSQQKRH